MREKSRSLPAEPRPDQTSRPSYASVLAGVVLEKKTKENREGKNAGEKDRDGEDRGKDRDKQDGKKQDKEKQKQVRSYSKAKSHKLSSSIDPSRQATRAPPNIQQSKS